jgi:hypothetical protein
MYCFSFLLNHFNKHKNCFTLCTNGFRTIHLTNITKHNKPNDLLNEESILRALTSGIRQFVARRKLNDVSEKMNFSFVKVDLISRQHRKRVSHSRRSQWDVALQRNKQNSIASGRGVKRPARKLRRICQAEWQDIAGVTTGRCRFAWRATGIVGTAPGVKGRTRSFCLSLLWPSFSVPNIEEKKTSKTSVKS